LSKFLIIQTAYIGDVILATSVVEKLAAHYPAAQIDFLVRKGNESLLHGNPNINEVIVWDKSTVNMGTFLGPLKKSGLYITTTSLIFIGSFQAVW